MPRAFTALATFSRDSRKASPRICNIPASGSVVIALISGMAALHSGHHVAQKTRRTGFFPRNRPSATGRPSRSGRGKSAGRAPPAPGAAAAFPPPPRRGGGAPPPPRGAPPPPAPPRGGGGGKTPRAGRFLRRGSLRPVRRR